MPEQAVAVVTGASSGIGEAFARRIARGKYDLLITARRAERLQALKTELEDRHGIGVETLVADLRNEADLDRVVERVGRIQNLAFMVHAAGFGTRGYFAEKDVDSQVGMIQVHDIAGVRLTRAALPAMIKQGRGAIILVSSTAAWAAAPGGVTYGASKAFLNAFCEGLHAELAGTGVQIQALCPGFTHSEFHSTPEFAGFNAAVIPLVLWMSADAVVIQSLKALRTNRVIVVTGGLNRVYTELARFGAVRELARKTITAIRNRRGR